MLDRFSQNSSSSSLSSSSFLLASSSLPVLSSSSSSSSLAAWAPVCAYMYECTFRCAQPRLRCRWPRYQTSSPNCRCCHPTRDGHTSTNFHRSCSRTFSWDSYLRRFQRSRSRGSPPAHMDKLFSPTEARVDQEARASEFAGRMGECGRMGRRGKGCGKGECRGKLQRCPQPARITKEEVRWKKPGGSL